jgi:hypothetical protein
MKAKRKLKLFVWQDVLRDYSSGVMFALAYDSDQARKIIIEKEGKLESILLGLGGDPKVITKPEGFAVWGGG